MNFLRWLYGYAVEPRFREDIERILKFVLYSTLECICGSGYVGIIDTVTLLILRALPMIYLAKAFFEAHAYASY